MNVSGRNLLWYLVVAGSGLLLEHPSVAAGGFRLATYNLENYVNQSGGARPPKTTESKAKILETIGALDADVVALQEIGTTNDLLELRAALRNGGRDYSFWEHVSGWDTNIHVAVLSRFPIVARRLHTNESFLLFGRRFRVSRGFAEVDIRVHEGYSFTLFVAHLKSRRPVPEADEAELREQEAILLREKINLRLARRPDANIIVAGDLNDTRDARSTRAIIGRGNNALIDLRPAERNGDNQPNANPRYDPRNVTWTHHYGKEDTYSRIDYLLVSRGMFREWISDDTYVLALPNWGIASDHRPLVAGFHREDK